MNGLVVSTFFVENFTGKFSLQLARVFFKALNEGCEKHRWQNQGPNDLEKDMFECPTEKVELATETQLSKSKCFRRTR